MNDVGEFNSANNIAAMTDIVAKYKMGKCALKILTNLKNKRVDTDNSPLNSDIYKHLYLFIHFIYLKLFALGLKMSHSNIMAYTTIEHVTNFLSLIYPLSSNVLTKLYIYFQYQYNYELAMDLYVNDRSTLARYVNILRFKVLALQYDYSTLIDLQIPDILTSTTIVKVARRHLRYMTQVKSLQDLEKQFTAQIRLKRAVSFNDTSNHDLVVNSKRGRYM